tara:strand:+ start:656 stop:838 length:183 start_codon:yes stop_codon:yes gene_type:complete
MNKKINKLKREFDDMLFEIIKARTLNYSDELNSLIKQISPQIENINNLLNYPDNPNLKEI